MRESTTVPEDYALSYLSSTGSVHHFKISSNCGDYYFGGRQFSTLENLIGFYSNCVTILEGEQLEMPVASPTVSEFIYLCMLLVKLLEFV